MLQKARVLDWFTWIWQLPTCYTIAPGKETKHFKISRNHEERNISILKSNPYDSDGFPLSEDLADDEFA